MLITKLQFDHTGLLFTFCAYCASASRGWTEKFEAGLWAPLPKGNSFQRIL